LSKLANTNALEVPSLAQTNPAATEVLRVWSTPGGPQQLTLRTTWTDSGTWGLVLVDIARHVANAYEKEGQNPKVVLARIRELFNVEWDNPTDEPKEIIKQ
jgi:hypothetical protein